MRSSPDSPAWIRPGGAFPIVKMEAMAIGFRIMEIYLGSWAVMAVIGYFIGNVKGNGAAGVVLGLVLGPIGWLIALCFSDSRTKCRMCHGVLSDPGVTRCKHCGCGLPVQGPTGQPGKPTQRTRQVPKKPDPFEAWEEQEQAAAPSQSVGLPPIQRKPDD